MKFYILNQVWGTNFIPDDSADFGFKNFFIPKTTILLLYRCVWKWFFPKYCHYFSFYDFAYTIIFFVEAMNLRKYARYPWAAMSHLTPTKWNVFFRPNSGMRELSDSIARNVSFLKMYKK